MIKKLRYLFISLFIGLGILNFSSAVNYHNIGSLTEYYSSAVNSGYKNMVGSVGSVFTDDGLNTKKILYLSNKTSYFFRYTDGLPYISITINDQFGYPESSISKQGFVNSFLMCDYIGLGSGDALNPRNCLKYEDFESSYYSNFLSKLKGGYFYYDYDWPNSQLGASVVYCFSSPSVNKSLCFFASNGSYSDTIYNWAGGLTTSDYPKYYSNLHGSLNLSKNLQSIPVEYLSLSPASSDGYGYTDDGEIVQISSDLDNSIKFYEDNFGWDINMCYVGTNDLTGAYGKPNVEFQYGSGATIYDLYYAIYGSFGNNKIHNVGSFINVWLLNYATWFQTATEDQIYMATYNGPDQNVSYIYTGFTFPFYNKRLAIYFMADLLSNQYITESSQGENIIYYCDMKLNYDNYKNGTWDFNNLYDLVDPKIKNRIQDYINYAINGQDGYSTPDGSSIWGNLMQSGYSIPNDLNPSNLFKDFYNKINGLVTDFVPVTSVGIIPWWILYPMLFLILFRIMRH